jgi:hypothetical protein
VFCLFGCRTLEHLSKFYIIVSSRFLEASGFSTHIEHLPPSVSSPRSQRRWSNYPLPLPGGTEGFRIRRASAPCPSPLVPRFQVRARNGDGIITPCRCLRLQRVFAHVEHLLRVPLRWFQVFRQRLDIIVTTTSILKQSTPSTPPGAHSPITTRLPMVGASATPRITSMFPTTNLSTLREHV